MSDLQPPNLFDFKDYKVYLRAWLAVRPHKGHGEKSRMAALLRCHVAYVSQVLGKSAQLSVEQAYTLSLEYFAHSEAECDFFLLLVQHARAGTHILSQHFDKKIRDQLEQRKKLKTRFAQQKEIAPHEQVRYFSAWYYMAVHLLITMPPFQNKEALAKALPSLSPEKLVEILDFLEKAGLAVRDNSRVYASPTSIHLDSDSPMISKHHTNWRMQAIVSLEREKPDDLHYSSAITVARADVPKVREALLAGIEKARGIVRASKEDSLYCYTLDLFELR